MVGIVRISPRSAICASELLPRNLEPSLMCTIRPGSNPIKRAQVGERRRAIPLGERDAHRSMGDLRIATLKLTEPPEADLAPRHAG